MAGVSVRHSIGELAADMAAIPPKAITRGSKVVRANIREGNKLAQGYARGLAGPHGKNYYKRLSAEMTGPLTGEYGPEGTPKTDFVGVGFRHGRNTDLPRSADVIGVKFAKDVGDMVDGLFW